MFFSKHLNTHETLKAKQDFELKCKDAGVTPLEYISDNGSAFTSKSYAAHLSNFSQIQQFAGVGTHHHNGVTENAIQTIMSIARNMILHSAIHWPEVSNPSLWHMAVQYAYFLYIKVPNPPTGLCPDDLFTKTRWEQRTYDQVLSDQDIEEWKKSAHKEIKQLESKETWVEVPTSEATSRFFQAHGNSITRELPQKS